MYTCSFTGHRPEYFEFRYNEDDTRCAAVKVALRRWIRSACDMGCRRFMTGCALGVDMWAAEAVIEISRDIKDIELVAVIPFKGHDSKWSDEQKIRYERMLSCCGKVLTLTDRYSKGAFYARDRYMVDNADMLIAVYNREKGHSGTGYTVRYAIGNDKPIIIIDPETLEETKINIELG
ncbi:MAG: SLOG family protein [Clostridia bacterium]|nr:SLOG family protein [Clostridia bacterium]